METLGGFPAFSRFGFAVAIFMETLEGFPTLPAFWLRRAKPGFAVAIHCRGDWI
jgi:hypothetical protein